jgi:hypothetical protein
MGNGLPRKTQFPISVPWLLMALFRDVDMFAVRPLSGDGADMRLITIRCPKCYFARFGRGVGL